MRGKKHINNNKIVHLHDQAENVRALAVRSDTALNGQNFIFELCELQRMWNK